MDKLTIFDSESAHMQAVVDVLCTATSNGRILSSSGPDMLIEFNASSNLTAKGFRGKFKFVHFDIETNFIASSTSSPVGKVFENNKLKVVLCIVLYQLSQSQPLP